MKDSARAPLKLLYVSHSFPPSGRPLENVGGMQRVATGLHDALSRHPDVELSSLLLETSWKATTRRMPGYFARILREIPRRVTADGIQVVLYSSMVTAATAWPLHRRVHDAGARLAAIPVGRDVTLPVAPYQWLVPRVLGSLDHVFPISDATARECIARGAAPSRVEVIPCGIDTSAFALPADRKEARAALLRSLNLSSDSLPPDAMLLCSVGRHQERKGFHWFVEEVVPHLPDNVVYLLAGEGPLTPRIRQAVTERNLADRVRLLGQVTEEQLRALYRGADLFVMPNVPVSGDIEGFGVVMLEAGLCGLPVVAADLEGIRDVVREGTNGHLLPSRDSGAFSSTILRYRDESARLAEASSRASAYTAETFSWDAVAQRFVDSLS